VFVRSDGGGYTANSILTAEAVHELTVECARSGKSVMSNQLVVFALDAQHYALPLSRVQRVVRMVEVTPLPKAPDVVLGVIDLQGDIIPVMSMRKRFGLPEPEANLSNQLIVANTVTRSIAMVVNSVTGVVERRVDEITDVEKIVPGAQYVEGMTRLEDGILFIHDLDLFLSKQEEQHLEGLLDQVAGQ
jgi:purine-binding chemotaxis protein CheW